MKTLEMMGTERRDGDEGGGRAMVDIGYYKREG
jgi:hypothetical protein